MLAKRSHACIYLLCVAVQDPAKSRKCQNFAYFPWWALAAIHPRWGYWSHGLIDSLECCNHLWAHVDELEPSDVVDLNALRRSLEIREGFNWTFFDERPSSSAAPLGNLRMLALGLKATCQRHANCSMMISSHKGVDKITASMHLHRNSNSEKFYSCQSACHSMCSCI